MPSNRPALKSSTEISAANSAAISAMKTKEFLETLPELVRAQLPPELSEFQVHPRVTSLTKFYYGRVTVHYEVAIQKRHQTVEVGLHFEGDPETNFRQLELLQSLSTDIRSSLGEDVAIEEWVRGWTRALLKISITHPLLYPL